MKLISTWFKYVGKLFKGSVLPEKVGGWVSKVTRNLIYRENFKDLDWGSVFWERVTLGHVFSTKVHGSQSQLNLRYHLSIPGPVLCFFYVMVVRCSHERDTGKAHKNKVHYAHRSWRDKVTSCHKEADSTKQVGSQASTRTCWLVPCWGSGRNTQEKEQGDFTGAFEC